MNYTVRQIQKFSDSRGDLVVFLQKKELGTARKSFGQIYLVTFKKKGIVRGNHYHRVWYEWFGIIIGKVTVTLEDVRTKERVSFVLDAKKDFFTRLEIGPNIAHSFRSLTDYTVLLNYADQQWKASDRIEYKVI